MNPGSPSPRGALAAGLAAAVILDAGVQLLWKRAASGVPPGDGALRAAGALAASPWFLGALAAWAAQLANWVGVLGRADLSFAQPFTALSYVAVLGAAAAWLHEPVPPARVAGVALILAGLVCISRTPARAAGEPAESRRAGAQP